MTLGNNICRSKTWLSYIIDKVWTNTWCDFYEQKLIKISQLHFSFREKRERMIFHCNYCRFNFNEFSLDWKFSSVFEKSEKVSCQFFYALEFIARFYMWNFPFFDDIGDRRKQASSNQILEKSLRNAYRIGKFLIHHFNEFAWLQQENHLIRSSCFSKINSFNFSSALSSNGGILTINIDKMTVKEAINNINYVRALAGLDHIGLGLTSSPKKYALLLAELARDRLWNNASLKKLVGGNIVRILREVSLVWLSVIDRLSSYKKSGKSECRSLFD